MDESKWRSQTIRGTEYIYIDHPYWDKAKKRAAHKREYIGKRVDGEFIPNRKYYELRNAEEGPGVSAYDRNKSAECVRIFRGVPWLFWHIAEKTAIVRDLQSVFREDWQEILSLAFYLAHDESQKMYRYEHWAQNSWTPSDKQLTSQRISELLGRIDEQKKMAYLRLQAERLAEEEYLVFDTTSISSFSALIKQARYGKNKENDKIPQLNLAFLYGASSKLPVYYRKLCGNIPDVSTLSKLLRTLPFIRDRRIQLILDRGFYSQDNVNDLLRCHYKFLTGCPINRKFVQEKLETVRGKMICRSNYDSDSGLYMTVFRLEWEYTQTRPRKKDSITFKRRMYLHVYYNERTAADACDELNRRLDQYEKELREGRRISSHEACYDKYFRLRKVRGGKIHISCRDEAVEDDLKNAGFFVLLSNVIADPREAIRVYRTRDLIEKCFEDLKDRLSMRRMSVASEENFEGKLLIQFVALQLLSYVKVYMDKKGLYATYTLQSLLDELDVIEFYKVEGSQGWFSEITRKQAAIYDALDIPTPS